MTLLLGIDPGANGGFAYQFTDGPVVSTVSNKLPDTEGDILDLIEGFHPGGRRVCYLENLVKFTGSPMPSSAMATYASNWGFLKGVLMAHKFQIVLVTPQTWQKALGLGTSKGLSKTAWKNKLKALAQQLYPGMKITLANADAALILRYGELQERLSK